MATATAPAPLKLDDADQVEQKHKEAVAVAVAKCADDTKGQTCYICMEGVKRRTGEGLVSGFCACRGGSSFVHVSCLAEQAKILFAEAEENNLDHKVQNARFNRWSTCGLCKQDYHGVVACALGWACWKTYASRPDRQDLAINNLGSCLFHGGHNEDALSVFKTELVMLMRLGAPEERILFVQGNIAIMYQRMGRLEEALRVRRHVYSRRLKLNSEHQLTLMAANNYADSLRGLGRFEEAKTLLRKTLPVVRRVLGEGHDLFFFMTLNYAATLYSDPDATFDDLREAVDTFEKAERTARRVFGGEHPFVREIGLGLQRARGALSEAQVMRIRKLFEAELELGSEETQPSGDA